MADPGAAESEAAPRPGNTLTWRDLYIQQHLSASTLSGREPPQLRPDRPDRTRFLLAFEMVLPVDADVDLEMPDRQQQLRDCEREWAVLHASLQELSSSPGTATPGGEHETMLLAHMPTIEGSLAHEWGQASGHNYLEGKSPFFCNRGQPRVRMALIRKADGKSLPLAAIEHQDGCYMYTRSPTRSPDDITEELDFEGYFSGVRKFPFQLNQRRIATDVGVSIKYHAAGCQHCGALDGLRVCPVAIDPFDDPFKAFVPPLKCVQCNQENMRAEHQKVRVASVDISIEDREEEEDDRTIYIKSVDALLEVVDSPHCAHLWV